MASEAVQVAVNGALADAHALLRKQARTESDRLNLRLLEADLFRGAVNRARSDEPRIAIVSLLFNWPSTGGGIVHTAELAQFLTRAGYDVCHIYAENPQWEIGTVQGDLPYPARALSFDDVTWNRDGIIGAFRGAVTEFQPDAVIVTDSWNTKPMLATAVADFPYFLRLAALECLCPLNNVRLIAGENGTPIQCHKNQLAIREACLDCVRTNHHAAGALHKAERLLARFDDPAYERELQSAFANAAGVLAVNPLIAAMCEPYTDHVHVIPSGFDAARFEDLSSISWDHPSFRLLFAGLVEEYMKGFHILFEACLKLWNERQDFELHVTAESASYEAPFLKYRGWQTQESLPSLMSECHAVVVPTIAQEALGRTAVEAMGAARPVIASRIGGLPFTVTDGFTGLLAGSARADDLARQCARLMDDRDLAQQLGENGRRRFLEQHTWDSVIERQYAPLFASRGVGA